MGTAEKVADIAGEGAALVLRGLARLRGARAFHPKGVGFEVALEPLGDPCGARALDTPGSGLVRLSRALGLPESLPDPCGLGVRLPDAYGPGRHQDLLLVSSGAGRLGRHAVLPSRGFADRPYSTILPYRLNGEPVVLGARALDPGPGPLLADLRGRSRAGLSFELALARPGGGWRPAATIRLLDRIPAEEIERLALDPANTGGALELAGFLNRLRPPSYRGSQAGRAARA